MGLSKKKRIRKKKKKKMKINWHFIKNYFGYYLKRSPQLPLEYRNPNLWTTGPYFIQIYVISFR